MNETPAPPMKRYRLLQSARIDGEVHGPGHTFTREAGDPMPERMPDRAPDHVGPDDECEMKLKCMPLFVEEIEGPARETTLPLMTAMPYGGSDVVSR